VHFKILLQLQTEPAFGFPRLLPQLHATLSDLAHKLRFAPYKALYQRIAVRYHLKPFDLEETAGYIRHHLRVAGHQRQLFSDSFLSAVYDHTKGVARKIINLCRSALLLGVTEQKQILDETDLKRVLLDMERQFV